MGKPGRRRRHVALQTIQPVSGPQEEGPVNLWRWPLICFSLLLVGIMIWVALGPRAEPERSGESPPMPQPVSLQPPFTLEGPNGPETMENLMGFSPLGVETELVTGEVVFHNDTTLAKMVNEAVGMMTGPYKVMWQEYLKQTTMRGDDPKRNFYVMVSTIPYQGVPPEYTHALPPGSNTASFDVIGEYLVMWLDPNTLVGWNHFDVDDRWFVVSALLHEMRHLHDHLEFPEIGAARERGIKAVQAVRDNAPTDEKAKAVEVWLDGQAHAIAFEMLGYNEQFVWIRAEAPGSLATALDQRQDAIGEMWRGWKGGEESFAKSVLGAYRKDFFGSMPAEELKPFEKGLIDTALKVYLRVLETKGMGSAENAEPFSMGKVANPAFAKGFGGLGCIGDKWPEIRFQSH